MPRVHRKLLDVLLNGCWSRRSVFRCWEWVLKMFDHHLVPQKVALLLTGLLKLCALKLPECRPCPRPDHLKLSATINFQNQNVRILSKINLKQSENKSNRYQKTFIDVRNSLDEQPHLFLSGLSLPSSLHKILVSCVFVLVQERARLTFAVSICVMFPTNNNLPKSVYDSNGAIHTTVFYRCCLYWDEHNHCFPTDVQKLRP